MKLKSFLFTVLTAVAMILSILAVACKVSPDEQESDTSCAGAYYYDADNDEYLLTFGEANDFILIYNNKAETGHYLLESETLSMTFQNEEEAIIAEYKNDAVVLTYNGTTMRFLKKVYYTVTFETNGGSSVAAQSVINGKTVAQPAQTPEREGYVFWGWYADADYTSSFAFDTQPVTQNITVYARWIGYTPGETVYTATFDAGDNAENPVKIQTIGGKIYGAPVPEKEGYTFKGWWASATGEADELTYMLQDKTVLTENTLFYALWEHSGASGNKLASPLVSVTSEGVEITAVQGTSNYRIQITGEGFDGYAAEGGTYYNISNILKDAPAGEYVISVTALSPNSSDNDSEPTVRYYKHKALQKVSFFTVVEPSTLVFNSVDNAQRYYISVECGNEDHNHTMVNLGTATTFGFSNCEMTEGGISFRVIAEADGYASSVSDVFRYERKLDAVEGLEVDEATQTLKWKMVKNAVSYTVAVNGVDYDNGNKTSFALKNFAKGELEIAVKPVTDGYNSPKAAELTYDKQTLAAPYDIRIDNITLKWNAVDGATSYRIYIEGKAYETEGNETEFNLLECSYAWLERQNCIITVQAIGEKSSLESDPVNARYMVDVEYLEMLTTLTYGNNTLTWDPVIGATAYEVQVNDGSILTVYDGEAFCEIVLNKAGENVIKVRYLQDVFPSEWAEIKVFAYTVSFDGRGSVENPRDSYVAIGDKIMFTNLTRSGYKFDGWYNAPGGAQGNAKEYKSEIFIGTGDIVLYAGWKPQEYSVNLVAGENATVETDKWDVAYFKNYSLPVPKTTDTSVAFGGWYSENGVKLTDEKGKSLKEWTTLGGGSAYAQWLQIFQFKQQLDGTYSVTKGSGLSSLTTATVPATYNGKLVTSVEMQAFASCSKLIKFNIPDTILTLNSDSAFYSCKLLEEVNVYETGMTADPVYTSIGGVVFKLRDQSGSFFRIDYFPVAKTGKYTLPDGVTEIPKRIFYNTAITAITIPASVSNIDVEAFYSCKNLGKVTFTAPRAGEEVIPLNIAKNAFKSCPLLTTVELPARLESIVTKTTESAFYLCNALTNIAVADGGSVYGSVDGYLTNAGKDTILYCPAGKSGDIEIPMGITAIGAYAFSGQTRIRNVKIPSYVTEIGAYAFYNCGELRKVTFSSSVLKIGTNILSNAFESCKKLADVIFEDGSNVFQIGASAFKSCTALASFTFPTTLETVGDSAFDSCTVLKEVIFSDSDKDLTLGKTIFNKCTALVVINFTANVSKIDTGIFSGCDSLENIFVDENNKTYADLDGVLYNKNFTVLIVYPKNRPAEKFTLADTLEEISVDAFRGNTKIKSVTISNKVTSIGEYAFRECTGITELIFEKGNDEATLTLSTGAFYGLNKITDVELPVRVNEISSYLFYNATGLKSVVMSGDITSIGSFAFNGCSSLSTINFPTKLTEIGASAFASTTNLKNITLNEGLTSIGASAFASSGLNIAIVIPDTVTTLGVSAFEKTSITAITFGSGITEIPNNIVSGCTSIKTVTIGKNVTLIGASTSSNTGAFYGVTSLTTVIFEEGEEGEELPDLVIADGRVSITATSGATTVNGGAFKGCTNLKEIVLPERLTVIGAGAFGSSGLISVTFAANGRLTEIGNGAFASTKLAGELTIPEGITTISNGAFANITSLKKVYLPLTLKDTNSKSALGIGSFYKNTGLTDVLMNEQATDGSDADALSDDPSAYPAFTVGDYAFNGCTVLANVTLPAGLTGMYDDKGEPRTNTKIFKDCSALKAFNLAAMGAEYSSVDGVLYNSEKSEIVFCPAGKNGTFTIPASVSIIRAGTFYKSKFTSIVFAPTEEGEEEIPLEIADGTSYSGAFAEMAGLSSIIIPSRTTRIGDYAFNKTGTSATTLSITLENDENGVGVTELGNNVFNGCTKLKSFNIPTSVTTIGNGCFHSCTGLTSFTFTLGGTEDLTIADGTSSAAFVGGSSSSKALSGTLTLPARLTNMPTYMFYYCAMTGVEFEEVENEDGSKERKSNVTKLGNYVYYYCTSLTEIVIPESVEEIDTSKALCYACTSVKKLTINSSKISVDDMQAYINCMVRLSINATYANKLEEVSVPESNTAFKTVDGVLYTKDGTKLLLVPYKKNLTAVSGVKKFDIPFGVTEIGLGAFFNQQNLTSVTIPKTVTKIDKMAFYGSKLSSIIFEEGSQGEELPNLVTAEGNYSSLSYSTGATYFGGVFGGMTALKSITLPARLTSIGGYAFSGCKALTEVEFAEGSRIDDTGAYAFSGTGLTEFTVPASLTALGERAFDSCKSLKTITFEKGSNIKEIGTMWLSGCSVLENIYNLPASGVIFTGRPFQGASAIKSAFIPEGNTALEMYAFNGCTALESVTLPSTLTSIGSNAFANCTSLKSIVIPDGVTSIAGTAFSGCKALKSITLPNSLQSLGTSVFLNCTALESITLPDSLEAIPDTTFSGCTNLKNVTLGEGIGSIGKNAFLNCALLESITIPSSVNSIGDTAFSGCSVLSEVTLNGAGSIGTSAFLNCVALKEIVLPASTTALGNTAFSGCVALQTVELSATAIAKIGTSAFLNCSSLKSISMGSKVTEIGDTAFKGCAALTDILLPNGLEKIGKNAFEGCLLLTEIVLPWTLQSLGTEVFKDCNFLESVEVMSGNEYYSSIDGVLFDKNYTQLILYPTNRSGELRIPSTVTSMADGVFKGTPITEIRLPDTITSLAASSFEGCKNLTYITLPANLTSIGAKAFYGCKNLIEINIPATVSTIGANAFEGCAKLTTLNIAAPDPNKSSEGLQTIGNYAFSGTALTALVMPDTVTAIGNYAFSGCPITDITFSRELATIGERAFEGIKITSLVIPANVTMISTRAFYGCTLLKTVEFAEGGTSAMQIGLNSVTDNYCFAGCTNLTTVILDARITSFTGYEFAGCVNLNNVTFRGTPLSNEVVTGGHMFDGCTGLTSISIPEYFKGIYVYTFSGCTNLTTVNFGNPREFYVHWGAFLNCSSLKEITLPQNTTWIGSNNISDNEGAFQGTGLTSFVIPSNVLYIGNNTFKNCKSLTSIVIPANVTAIYSGAFSGTGITEIVIPGGVTTIGQGAFSECKNMQSADIPNTVESLSASLFQNCTALEWVILPDRWVSATSTQTQQMIFAGCTNLKKVRLQTSEAVDTDEANDPAIGDIEFAKGIEKLGEGLFENCTSLKTVIIPDGISTLYANVFKNCSSLNKVVLPASLSTMSTSSVDGSSSAFSGTPLDTMDFVSKSGSEEGSGVAFKIEDGVLYGGKVNGVYTELYAVSPEKTGSFTTPAGVTTVKDRAFSGSKLTSITLGEDVTQIGYYAFENSSLLTTFAMAAPEKVTTINSGAFRNCTSLTSVQLPTNDAYVNVSNNLFENCTALTSLDLSDYPNITGINNYAFMRSGLTSFNFPANIGSTTGTTVGTSAFANCVNLRNITFDREGLGISLGNNAFQGCTGLKEIHFPSRLSNTGNGNGLNSDCFEGCTSLTTVTFAETWQSNKSRPSIQARVFKNCTSLESIVLPDYMGSVGESCFEGCKALASVTFGNWDGATFSINASAFKGCTLLKTITLPNNLNVLAANVFENSGLTQITVPAKITEIGASAFEGCISLTSVTAKGVTTVNASAFKGCANLSALELSDNVSVVGASAFEGCSSLTSLTFTSASLTEIGAGAFKNCTNLETLTLGANVSVIGASAFENCSALSALNIESETSIGVNAFKGCTSLTSITVTYAIITMDTGVFAGWTAEQTINVVGLNKEPMNWEEGWNGNAEVVWNYTEE